MKAEEIFDIIKNKGREGRWYIESLKDEIKKPALINALAIEGDTQIKTIVCNIMATQPDSDYIPMLLKILKGENLALMPTAADAIGNILSVFPDDPDRYEVGQALIRLLTSSNDVQIKAAALYAIGMMRLEQSASYVAKLLDDDAPNIRWNAAEAMAHLQDNSFIPLLEQRLKIEKNPRVIRNINLALQYLSPNWPFPK